AMVHLPGGGEVRLSQVALAGFGRSPSIIRREDGRRVLSVTASVDEAVATGGEVAGALERGALSELSARHPELSYSFGGEQREMSDSLGSLVAGFALAMLAIYALLAIPFGSYTKPVIIMAAIPFALVGGLLGHIILGMPLAVISLFGMIGLSGVIVNDSLMMIDYVNERQAQGMPPREAVVQGAKDRFRPILLTSITTFLGVAPLVFEGSVQAQFLKPLAAALGFGILFGTAVLMMLVPSLAMVHQRVLAWRGR
ncbi:MAG: efflux RND transporter permease subunit, partial [Gemmatimonadetes bacterium]|nr:efflux RND transporter permease subunit [Gemmatimonadota bacterium]